MERLNTVKTKQLSVFLVIILLLVLAAEIIFHSVRQFAISMICQQMETQAEYYVDSMDAQMDKVMRQLSDFFVDRQLGFLVDEGFLDDYDERNALLSVQEKIVVLILSNEVVKEATLFIPESQRVITQGQFLKLDEEYREKLSVIKRQLGNLIPQGEDLLYSLSETPYAESVSPFFYLQVVLDGEEITRQLNSFVLREGGVCWYNHETEWFLEDTEGAGRAKDVLQMVGKQSSQEKIRLDGTDYLVNVKESRYFGNLIQYCSEEIVLEEMKRYTTVFYGLILLAVICAAVFSAYTERLVNRPLQKLHDAFYTLQKGDMEIRISHSSGDEFGYIYEGFNHMVEELQRMIEEVYVQKNLAAQAELKQLQAQISPHFLYNSFFLFSGRVGRGDYDGARMLADYLGTYFRYLARNASDIVTLEDEMTHAEAYARIQESRFSSRMKLLWEEPQEEIRGTLMPRLIVQPILENAYKHGLEEKEEGGILQVYCRKENREIHICIEDNGEVEEDVIQAMRNSLSDGYTGEVTGMVNVHRRLKNYFRQKGGLGIKEGGMGGVLVVISIPLEMEEENVPVIDR